PDGSEESLDCTPGHPFWADGEGWVPACHLQPGQDVATLSGPARVASVAPTGRTQTVYNFEVAGTHCYFVGAGGELVHNGPCGGVGPVNKGKAGVQKSLAAAKARGEHVLGTEVTFKAGGVRTRADILVRTPAGRLKVIEAKNGPSARLSRNQKAGFPALRRGGAVPVGANAEAANLTPGQALGPVDVQVDPWP
ncbi:MAG: hypothetical protein IT452_22360, partial [Planctomycetia bacterium]|nr:hypothetical protein [Planctomycetia bacterium]